MGRRFQWFSCTETLESFSLAICRGRLTSLIFQPRLTRCWASYVELSVLYTVSVSVRKLLYLTLVRSHLLYCSVVWRPYLRKHTILLERVQRRATKFILNDYNSDYKTRLNSLGLLPLSMVLELNDIIFFLKSLLNSLSLQAQAHALLLCQKFLIPLLL